MADTPKPDNGFKWRLAVLATTMVMGAALLGSGILGYVQAKKNAELLAFAEVGAMLFGLKREINRGAASPSESLAVYFADREEGDIRAAALLGPDGEVVASFGQNLHPFEPLLLGQFPHHPKDPAPHFRCYDDGVVHATFSLERRMGRKRGPGHAGLAVAVEAVSKSGPTIVSNALFALIVEVSAAVLLLTSALLFSRQKSLAESRALALEAQRRETAIRLERDERLKALGRMSAVLGHELRNPIAALKGHAQLLLESLEEAHPSHARAAVVVNEAKTLETLTSQILDFVRKGELKRTKVYLDDLAESAAALSGIESVTVSAPRDRAWVLDRARMEQALINLLLNASQASPEGAPIDLVIAATQAGLSIQVRDRGGGIATEDLERIFQPFFTSRSQGTGLGLALVKRIAEAHCGEVFAANHPDGGAVFTLQIPERAGADETGTDDA